MTTDTIMKFHHRGPISGYSARQLLSYHAFCRSAHPKSRVLPPGGRQYWDDMTAEQWLDWFMTCLMEKASRGMDTWGGKGNRARRRAEAIADAKAECKNCGQKTGRANQRFCSEDCAHAYYS